MTKDEAIALVTRERDALGAIGGLTDYREFDAWRRARNLAEAAAVERLTAAGAVVRDDFKGTSIKLVGIRTTCTGGLSGALGNWLARVEREAGR